MIHTNDYAPLVVCIFFDNFIDILVATPANGPTGILTASTISHLYESLK